MWERRGDSGQGSSIESDIPLARPNTRGVYSQEAKPSGHGLGMEDVVTKDLGSVESCGNLQADEAGEEVSFASHPGEEILVTNPNSKVT